MAETKSKGRALIRIRRAWRKVLAGEGNEAGFTLVELLIVVAVIAVLAAIAIPMYVKFIQNARETSVISFLNIVVKAQDLYRMDNVSDEFAVSFDDLRQTRLIPTSTGGASEEQQHDYKFTIASGLDADNVPFWNVSALPLLPTSTSKWFYVDETGTIRYSIGSAASASSSPIR